jgi:hypothetical protein
MSTLAPCVGLARKECMTMAGQKRTAVLGGTVQSRPGAFDGVIASEAAARRVAQSQPAAPAASAAPAGDRLGPVMAAALLDIAEQAGVVTAATRPQWATRLHADSLGTMDELAGLATASVPAGVRARATQIASASAVSTAGGSYTHPAAVLAGVVKAKAEARATEIARAPARVAEAAASLPARPGQSLARALGAVPGRASSQPLGGDASVRMPRGWKG